MFWSCDLLEKTPEERFPDLLESLGARLPGLRPALGAQGLDDLPLGLVARAVECAGDRTPVPQVHDWLRIGAGYRPVYPDGAESVRAIRGFLEGRPDLHKALWLEGLKRCPEGDDFHLYVRQVAESLYVARLPEDFGRFCLDRATELADARPRLAEWLLDRAIQRSAEEGITLEELTERTRWSGNLGERLPNLLHTPLPPGYLGLKRDSRDFEVEQRAREAQWERQVHSASGGAPGESGVARAAAPPCEGVSRDSGPVREWVQVAEHLVLRCDPGRGGAGRAARRSPTARMSPRWRRSFDCAPSLGLHYLSLPFLAGLEVIEREDPARLGTLDDTRWRTAVALYYTVPTGRRESPPWYRELVRSRPELVAEVLVRCAKPEIAAGSDSLVHLDCLVTDADHAEVAGRASLAPVARFSGA